MFMSQLESFLYSLCHLYSFSSSFVVFFFIHWHWLVDMFFPQDLQSL